MCRGKPDKVYVVKTEQGASCSHVSISTSDSGQALRREHKLKFLDGCSLSPLVSKLKPCFKGPFLLSWIKCHILHATTVFPSSSYKYATLLCGNIHGFLEQIFVKRSHSVGLFSANRTVSNADRQFQACPDNPCTVFPLCLVNTSKWHEANTLASAPA